MNEETKFDLDKDIIMQIEMDSYMKYNDTIALMNDHLGEIYGYSDIKDMEEIQLKYEKKLAYKAIKDLQEKVEQLNNIINELEELLKQILLDTKKPTILNNFEKNTIRITIEHIQNKLQELKDGD